VDAYVVEGPFPTVSYRSGLCVYEEALVRGQLVARGWNAAGFMGPEAVRFDPATHPAPQSFWLEMDGQLLASHWEWEGVTRQQRREGLHVAVALRHAVRPVAVRVHMLLDGTPILTRWLEVTNRGERPAALSVACPWSGVLQSLGSREACAAALEGRLYALGYMQDAHHLDEGAFGWRALPPAAYRVDGRYRRNRHRHPMFVLRNEHTGEHWIGQLAWSGGYAFEFDCEPDWRADGATARLTFRAGPDGPAPLRVLAPGETVKSPELHLGLLYGDLDACVQAMHDHLRRSVLWPPVPGRSGLVESGIGPEQEITYEAVYHEMDTAAAIGAEVFFIDASWYTPPKGNWASTVGDWDVGSRFPDGLAPIRERAHELGLRFGLWMEPERLGAESRTLAEHPDWVQQRYDGRRRGDLDLTRPEVAAWMEGQITRVIEEHRLDFFRLDYNVGNIGAGFQTLREGFVENNYWRYYDVLYALFERLRRRFPDVIFENCASGGGRTDLGMVRLMTHTWVTDWQLAPRAFSITNGMTMALPPERIDRLFGMGQNGHRYADLDFQARLCILVHPTLGYLHHVPAPPNPQQVARVRHHVERYKTFIRPFHPHCRVYHHTPA
ncbi:MAG TPA: glycoside hydrolase family 36 protein, partial [Chloroflexota bacterium]|nr:glycoside hydrolase family 36 protein [Chloroflexota bacterium]